MTAPIPSPRSYLTLAERDIQRADDAMAGRPLPPAVLERVAWWRAFRDRKIHRPA